MKETLPYGELWLLERAVECDGLWLPLWRLPGTPHGRDVGFCEALNCPLNGLSLAELADVLWHLCLRGEIEFEEHTGDDQVALRPTLAADVLTRLVEALEQRRGGRSDEDSLLCYRATARGISRWERHAVPNWRKYRGEFTGRLWEAGEATWSQSTSTESFAREVLEVYSLDLFNPVVMHWETARLEHQAPWEPMPGKELPCGVTVSLRVTEYGPQGVPCEDWTVPIRKEHERRFREICRWYENSTATHPDCPRRPEHGIRDGSS